MSVMDTPTCIRREGAISLAVAPNPAWFTSISGVWLLTYKTLLEAREDVLDYNSMFYNPKRNHVRNGMLSPLEFKPQQEIKPKVSLKLRAINTKGYCLCQSAHARFRCDEGGIANP